MIGKWSKQMVLYKLSVNLLISCECCCYFIEFSWNDCVIKVRAGYVMRVQVWLIGWILYWSIDPVMFAFLLREYDLLDKYYKLSVDPWGFHFPVTFNGLIIQLMPSKWAAVGARLAAWAGNMEVMGAVSLFALEW